MKEGCTMGERVVCSTELTREEAELFKEYLRENDIYFEASEADHLIYFSCEMSAEEMDDANEWLDAHI